MRYSLGILLGMSLLPLLGACETEEDQAAGVVTFEGAIYGGDAADKPHHYATVAFVSRSGDSVTREAWCSGTLVAPDVVVTAAHCLDTARGGRTFRTISPSRLAVFFGEDVQTDPNGVFVWASATLIHPDYNRRELLDDIALVRLSTPVVGGVTVPGLPDSLGLTQTDADNGTSLEFAGFGRTEVGYEDKLLHADGVIDGLGCTPDGCFGLDDPATQFSYLQQVAGPCFGDSGGPAYIQRGSSWYLAGLTSWGGDDCSGFGAFGVSTRVDAYEGWIAAFAGPTGPDCSDDGACNASCPAGDDPDCTTGPDCSDDGTCNASCPAGDDPDCTTGPDCSDDGACNASCPAGDDPDCAGAPFCGDGICGAGESCDGRGATDVCSDCNGKLNGKKSGRFCEVEGICVGKGC
jgi:hypothetical protein